MNIEWYLGGMKIYFFLRVGAIGTWFSQPLLLLLIHDYVHRSVYSGIKHCDKSNDIAPSCLEFVGV